MVNSCHHELMGSFITLITNSEIIGANMTSLTAPMKMKMFKMLIKCSLHCIHIS